MNRTVSISFLSLFIVMLGYGVTLAVLPTWLGPEGLGLTRTFGAAAFHVGALTGVYALAQFIAAPFWGRVIDRNGTRRVLVWTLAGFGVSQVVFANSMSMPWLYSSRVFAGLFAAAMFPIAARAVASTLPEHQQRRGMAWLNASAALGVVAGPALGRLTDPLVDIGTTGLGGIDSKPYAFSFLILALFSMAVIPLAWWGTSEPGAREKGRAGASSVSWWQIGMSLRSVIAIVIASQLAMSLFMTAFALYADASLGYGPDGIGRVFALCGLLTAAVQVGIVWAIARHWDENKQIIWGSAAMAAGLLVIPLVPVGFGMTSAIAILVVGAAVIAPALLVVAAKVSPEHAGVAAGLVGSGTYLGQVLGPLLAGILFPWSDAAPFYASAGVMFAAAAMCLYSPLVPRVRLLKESVA